jgi:lipopolysaccharide/colanic/teichoic acid biosynthesis glycosyltransferase
MMRFRFSTPFLTSALLGAGAALIIGSSDWRAWVVLAGGMAALVAVAAVFVPSVLRTEEARAENERGAFAELVGNPYAVNPALIPPLRPRVGKRLLDVCLAAAGLVFTGPIFVLVAAALRISHGSGSPIIARYPRVRASGGTFNLYRFAVAPKHDDDDDELEALADEPTSLFVLIKRRPLSRVGAFLRSTSLEHLPSLFNILRGDMSLVGPQPRRPLAASPTFEWPVLPYSTRPGLVGYAQVLRAMDIDPHLLPRVEALYSASSTIWSDIQIPLFPHRARQRALTILWVVQSMHPDSADPFDAGSWSKAGGISELRPGQARPAVDH